MEDCCWELWERLLKSAGYWSGKPTMVIMVTYPYISLPCCFSILTCHASLICGWVKTSVSCQRVGGLGGWASTDPRIHGHHLFSSRFISSYYAYYMYVYIYIYIICTYGGFLKWGYPNSWMVYSGTSIYTWMRTGVAYFRKPSYDSYVCNISIILNSLFITFCYFDVHVWDIWTWLSGNQTWSAGKSLI